MPFEQDGKRYMPMNNRHHKDGSFNRPDAAFRNWISNSPDAEFPAERDRYHLYVSYACPWAHRCLIVRQLKGLEDIITYTSTHWEMLELGWRFANPGDAETIDPAVTADPHHENAEYIRHVYLAHHPGYEGLFSVPVLFDKKAKRVVSNESSEIIRMFYTAFDTLLPAQYRKIELLPQELKTQIEETNKWTYDDINNGVYKSGIAATQKAYEEAVTKLFESLDRVEKHLAGSPGPYYHGEEITEADVRLYPTIVRFDPVYVQHFKCNIRDIRSGYPAIHKWLRHLYWNVTPFHDTTKFDHIKKHYTCCHRMVNPFGITPVGPLPDILAEDEEVNAVKASGK